MSNRNEIAELLEDVGGRLTAIDRKNGNKSNAVLAARVGKALASLQSEPKPVTHNVGYLSRGDARWLAYCPDNGVEFFQDKESAENRAKQMIEGWLDSDGWAEEAAYVFAAQVTGQSTECDVVNRPPDSEMDEAGCDPEGRWWDADWDRMCNYRLEPVLPDERVEEVWDKAMGIVELAAGNFGSDSAIAACDQIMDAMEQAKSIANPAGESK